MLYNYRAGNSEGENALAMAFIDRFDHRPGGHCSSTALRDLLRFYGHEYSEEMVFGLGAGLGFIYYHNPQMRPSVYVGGRAFMLEEQLADNLGFGMEVVSGLDPDEGWAAVKRLMDGGVPVMVRTDVYYLDYLRAKVHFSGHRVVLAGYDDEKGVAFVADNDRDAVQECSLASLSAARSSTWFPQPAGNAYHLFDVPARLAPLDEAIPRALELAAATNLNAAGDWAQATAGAAAGGVTAASGLEGLALLSSGMPRWPEVMDPESLTLVCRNIYVSAEKGGTGYGGNFRRMYGRFLIEAGDVLGDESLSSLGREFVRIGDLWSGMCLTFKELSADGAAAVEKASPMVVELYERERDALIELRAAARRLRDGT